MTDTQEAMREESRQTNARVHGCAFNGWQCFHCGEIFETVGAARTHFGTTPDAIPGCMIKVSVGAERGLLMKLRETEDLLAENIRAQLDEDTALHRQLHKMQSRHSDALRNAEELGYERGLKAAAAQSAEKIARLEAELADSDLALMNSQENEQHWVQRAAAAELSNRQLLEALHAIADDDSNHEVFTRGYLMKTAYEIVAREAIAQQPSTEALDAHVAKLVPPGWKVVPIEPSHNMVDHANTAAKAANISISGRLESAEAIERVLLRSAYVAMIDAAPLPPAPEKG